MPDKLQIDQVNICDGQPVELYVVQQAIVNAASSGDNVVVSGVSGRRIRLVGQSWSVAADVTVGWKSGSGGSATVLIPPRSFKAGGGMDGYWGPHGYYCQTAPGQPLNMYLGASVQVSGTVNYIVV